MRIIQQIVIVTIVVLLASVILFRLVEKVYEFDTSEIIGNVKTYNLEDKTFFRISVELNKESKCYTTIDRDGNINAIATSLKLTQLIDVNYSVSGDYSINMTCCSIHNECNTELFKFKSDGTAITMG